MTVDAPALGTTILRAHDLVKHFPVTAGVLKRQTGAVHAVDGVSLELAAGDDERPRRRRMPRPGW